MDLNETSIKEILEEVLEQSEKTQKTIEHLERRLADKDNELKTLIEDNKALIASFEHKYETIEVKAPQPDLSAVNLAILKGFVGINQTIEKGPKPIVRQIRFTLFPEQVRTPEYYHVMMRWLVWILLGSLFMVLTYLLIDKRI
ncbi:hypothetical protein [Pedobacter foliorum]|uniref:hypothetical protein n=1 Tax=Pedobacter foliorum TaxID=2739058 RepID=UPI001566F23F|nr:hypothetical protein [Pedobacter foliorum]NRF38539.1 hypothetical protein [Pedobacter foliorum]